MAEKIIKKEFVTKIEGHAKLTIKIDGDKIKKANLEIFEGSRFFEKILRNQLYTDLGPISSRICGVCSVAHGLASLRAIENAFNVSVSKQTRALRELAHLGGIIQSHALHLYFMVLPDYLGYDSALGMVKRHRTLLEQGLKIKRVASGMVRVVGGRDVHPFTFLPGGFSKQPNQKELDALLKQVRGIRRAAENAMKTFAKLSYPEFERERDYFALKGEPYFFGDKTILCRGIRCVPVRDYEKHFREYFVPGSTSEFVDAGGKDYMVGALARVLNNGDALSRGSKPYVQLIEKKRFSPYMNNLAQALEIYEGFRRAEEIIKTIKVKKEDPADVRPKKGVGFGAIEAPRGILFHKYEFDKDGYAKRINITTPTSQNLENMEENIRALLPSLLGESRDVIVSKIEQLIRAYDPCISCSTHFLDVVWE